VGLEQRAVCVAHGDLDAAFGVGALLGYIFAGSVRVKGRARAVLLVASLTLQSGLIPVLLLVRHPGFQVPGFVLIGAFGGIFNVHFISLLQIATPRALLGRVQGLATTISAGVMPLGMALSGIAFDLVGKSVPIMFSLSSGLTVLLSLLGLFSRHYRSFLQSDGPEAPAA
jgi:predicted MFS family arabinose efflux permease